jgi:tetratricopeptide (TPR) repeat protein
MNSFLVLLVLVLPGVSHPAFSAEGAQSAASAPHRAQSARWGPRSSERFDRLQRWLVAVAQHEPGSLDDLLPPIGAWSKLELVGVLDDLKRFRTFLTRASHPVRPQTYTFEGHDFTKRELQELLGLNDQEAAKGDINRVLKRGALLHTDIALNPVELGITSAPDPQGRLIMRTADGRAGRLDFGMFHWEFARLLLDAVLPEPGRDEMIRMWYRATIASLHNDRTFAEAGPQLARALVLFPDDARILFYNGALQETFAAASVQSVVQSTTFTPGFTPAVSSARVHLAQAERFFRQALKIDPASSEIHVHLANVVGRLGRHQEAATELRGAIPSITDARLEYYAQMFLGREEEMLGHSSAARECFERAATLYPRAQSPQLALAQLAWRDADASTAFRTIERLFLIPPYQREREDPWWVYEAAHVRDAEELLEAVRAPFLSGSAR